MTLGALLILLLTCCSALFADTIPTVIILATGGTIASKRNPAKGGYEPGLTGEDLVQAIPAVRSIAHIQVEQISNISSSDMTPEIWLKLAGRVKDLLVKPEIAGIVVTHGTNTLEETAYFLDLVTDGNKPVIMVGAQRPASDPDSDGPRNLLGAIRVAISPEAVNKGVMVVMNGQINSARDVTKTNTSQVETFRGLEFGALGVVDESAVRFYRAPVRRQRIEVTPETKLARVEILLSYAGEDGRLLRLALQSKLADAFVIAGTGLGSVSSAMFDAIKQAREDKIPVVISTRVPTGRVFPLSATKGSALELQNIGCVLADNLNPQKARVLLMLALTKTKDPENLQKFFYY
jgi:L-asparaginase